MRLKVIKMLDLENKVILYAFIVYVLMQLPYKLSLDVVFIKEKYFLDAYGQ